MIGRRVRGRRRPASLRRYSGALGILRWPTAARPVLRTSITAVSYVGLFALTNAMISTRPPAVRQAWVAWASTDLVNLAQHPLGCLVVSAFLDSSDTLLWIGLGLIGLSSAGRALGNLRCAIVLAVSHVVSTAASEGVLAYRIAVGAIAASERVSVDIGPSYVVVAALAVGVAYGRTPWRITSGIAFALLAPQLFDGLNQLHVAAVGHCCATLIGIVAGFFLQRNWRGRERELTAPADKAP
jgi:hypothetical protein